MGQLLFTDIGTHTLSSLIYRTWHTFGVVFCGLLFGFLFAWGIFFVCVFWYFLEAGRLFLFFFLSFLKKIKQPDEDI